jgi:hypothetical protein
MITKKQNSWYWREWSKAHRADLTLDRHECHIAALGHDKSHTTFTNEEFDLVIAEFLSISEPDNLDMQIRLLRQPKTRLIHKISEMAPPAYVTELLHDRWHTDDLHDLDVSDLHQLRNTLKSRSNALRRRIRQPDQPASAEVLTTADCPF